MRLWLCLLVWLVLPARAEELPPAPVRYLVSGEILATESGNLIIHLGQEDTYGGDRPAPYLVEEFIGEKEKLPKRVAFRFEGVPPGRYALRCFIDQNENRKLDIGLFGPKEPWGIFGLSRPVFHKPSFDEIAFAVTSDRANLTITAE